MQFTKNIILVLAMAFVQSCISQSQRVTEKITFYQPYCGGARPSKEMSEAAQQPKLFVNRTVIIVSSKGKVDSAKTNNAGILTLKLKQGTYKLYEAWRYYKSTPDGAPLVNYNDSCLREEWKKEMRTVIFRKKLITRKPGIDIYEYCPWSLPCLKETSMPPMRE